MCKNKKINIMVNELWDKVSCPRVSIITPVYNRSECLLRALQSVECQTFRDFEYIIVNDGSTEPQIDEIVIGFIENINFPLMYIKKRNGGVHTARNAGIKESRGEIIIFLDADDEYKENAVEVCIREWENIPCDARKDYAGIRFCCENDMGGKLVKIFLTILIH